MGEDLFPRKGNGINRHANTQHIDDFEKTYSIRFPTELYEYFLSIHFSLGCFCLPSVNIVAN